MCWLFTHLHQTSTVFTSRFLQYSVEDILGISVEKFWAGESATVSDHTMKQSTEFWRCSKHGYSHTTRRPTKDCHPVFVTSKSGNVLLYPLQGKFDVPKSEVLPNTVAIGIKISKNVEAIVDSDDNNVLLSGEEFTLILPRCTSVKTSAMDVK